MEVLQVEEYLKTVAGMMALAARTAPKAIGKDYIEIKILTGPDIAGLANEMIKYGEESGKPNYDRDGGNVRKSEAVLLLSLKEPLYLGLNCGACGFDTCSEMDKNLKKGPEFSGPLCTWRVIDLGIALGSAVKTASLFNADNRIMYRIGVAALRKGLIEGEIAIGVPLSATGKSIYFDR
ncbi:MAG: ferredoxin domain-containing protein [Dethiobacteria bacterium]